MKRWKLVGVPAWGLTHESVWITSRHFTRAGARRRAKLWKLNGLGEHWRFRVLNLRTYSEESV